MLKVYALINRKPGWTAESFHAHWIHPHGTLTKALPQVLHYVQNHAIEGPRSLPGVALLDVDGIPAIWVDDLSALQAMETAPGRNELRADADILLDRSRLRWLTTEETVLKAGEPAGSPINAILLFELTEGSDLAPIREAIAAVAETAGPLVSVRMSSQIAGPGRALIGELTYADPRDLDTHWATIGPVLAALVELPGVTMGGVVTRQHRLK